MNKKIKSAKEIEKEVSQLFDNYKTEKELMQRIYDYFCSLTGKETLSLFEILGAVSFEVIKRDKVNGSKLRDNELLISLLPQLKFLNAIRDNTKELSRMIRKNVTKNFDLFSSVIMDMTHLKIPLDIILTMKEFSKYNVKDADAMDVLKKVSDENKTFDKLILYFLSNEDVSVLLNKYLYEAKKKFIMDLIYNEVIPLKSLLIYYDKELNPKENLDFFFSLFKKKFSRLKIQNIINRGITDVRKGKYPVPYS